MQWHVDERWLPDGWWGDVSPLPSDQQRRLATRALDVAFSGERLATLTVGNQSL